jgi:hypothetical protein
MMRRSQRIMLAAAIVAVDVAVFFLPLTAILLAYVLIFNPPWFKRFIDDLYKF